MDRWFGKHWLLRCALLLSAAALCFGVWPRAAQQLRQTHLHQVTTGNSRHLSKAGACPVLLADNGGSLYAWDWRTGRRWAIPNVPGDSRCLPICHGGRTEQVAFKHFHREDFGIIVVDVTPPHDHRAYKLPQEMAKWDLLTVTSPSDDLHHNFAVFLSPGYETDDSGVYVVHPSQSLKTIDLSTGQDVDTKNIRGSVAVIGEGDELEVSRESPKRFFNGVVDVKDLVHGRLTVNQHGILVPSERKPVNVSSFAPPTYILAPDGRHVAELSDMDRESSAIHESNHGFSVQRRSTEGASPLYVVVRDRASGEPLAQPQQHADIRYFTFSSDSKYVFYTDAESVHRVYDVDAQTTIASDERAGKVRWFAFVMFSLGALFGLIALVLEVRESSFEVAGFYYVLAVVFFDSASTAIYVWLGGGFRFIASYAALVAIGAYLACGDRRLSVRLRLGSAAFAVVMLSVWIVNWSSTIDTGLPPNSNVFRLLSQSALAALFVVVSSAIPASVPFLLFGWSLARQPAPIATPRFQFGINSLLLTMSMAAITFAAIRSLSAFQRGDGALVVASFVAVFAYLFHGAIVLTLMGFWFRRSPFSGLVVLATIIVGLLLIMIPSFLFELGNRGSGENLRQISSGLLFIVYQCVAFCFPMYLARKHGFHWVKVSRLPEGLVPPETAAVPTDASLSLSLQSH